MLQHEARIKMEREIKRVVKKAKNDEIKAKGKIKIGR